MALVAGAVVATLIALAARASADPVVDDRELDPALAELTAQPENADAPDSLDAQADLEMLGIGGIAGTEDWLEAQARHQRPSPWGRLDLELSMLHRTSAPATAAGHTFDELWLVLVWRR